MRFYMKSLTKGEAEQKEVELIKKQKATLRDTAIIFKTEAVCVATFHRTEERC